MTNPSHIEFEKEFSDKLTIHKNLHQEVIITTVDKIRICLMNNIDRMTIKQAWIAPLGIFATLATTFYATSFQDFYLKAEVWKAIYIITTGLVLFWLAKSLIKAWNAPSKGSIDSIIDELKNTQREFGLQSIVEMLNMFQKPIVPKNRGAESASKPPNAT